MFNTKSQIYIHEWLVIVFFISILIVLTFLSHSFHFKVKSDIQSPFIRLVDENVLVAIEGAVVAPGQYELKKGSTVEELLKLAGVKPDAELKKVKKSKVLRKGDLIKIPGKEVINITIVYDDCKRVEVKVPKGTKYHELASLCMLEGCSDYVFFKKKHLLKDGEEITLRKVKKR